LNPLSLDGNIFVINTPNFLVTRRMIIPVYALVEVDFPMLKTVSLKR
jgi:hypothetical protein